MALTAPSTAQKRFAGQLAWERGKKIATMPDTSSALSGLIQELIANHTPLPTAEWQVEAFRRLVGEAIARIEDFDVSEYSEVPGNRAEANQAIHGLRKRLSGVEFRNARSNAASYLVDEGSDEAIQAATAQAVEDSRIDPDDVPF